MADAGARDFWNTLPLGEMSDAQWEALCDGCGRCCLHKLQDADSGEIHYTAVACRLLDLRRCRCRRYDERQRLVPDCVVLDRRRPEQFGWLPDTCAYRLLSEGRPLPDWHPLLSGDPDSVHRAGISVRGRVVSEEGVHEEQFQEMIIRWVPATRWAGD